MHQYNPIGPFSQLFAQTIALLALNSLVEPGIPLVILIYCDVSDKQQRELIQEFHGSVYTLHVSLESVVWIPESTQKRRQITVHPRFCPFLVGWNLGWTQKFPTSAEIIQGPSIDWRWYNILWRITLYKVYGLLWMVIGQIGTSLHTAKMQHECYLGYNYFDSSISEPFVIAGKNSCMKIWGGGIKIV